MSGRAGWLAAAPIAALLALGFALPILLVAALSLAPPRTFDPTTELTAANYAAAFAEGYHVPLLWSLLGAVLTTLICLALAWPTAKALVRLGGRWATVAAILIALLIFISESVRLFGMSLFMMPGGGILAGTLRELAGLRIGSVLNTRTAALIGLVYVHFPFMLFPLLLGLSLIPADRVEAARDLGANAWRVFLEIEAPLAAPGAAIGALLCFVLSLGAYSEASILGGRAVVVAAQAIEQRFNYAQDWPLGSALTVLIIVVTMAVVFPIMRRIDLDRLIRR